MNKIEFSDININGGFWKKKQDMIKDTTIMSVYNRFNETGRFDAFICDKEKGKTDPPHVYWDSDVAKWLEGAAYIIHKERNPELEEIIDTVVELIEKNRDESGYYNSHFLVTRQDERFTHRDDHELYCAGHLMEAAIAYHKATGKGKFLDIMCKYADYIYKVFAVDKSAGFVTPGHPEIELALVKLYEHTGDKKYLELSSYFVEERGKLQPKVEEGKPEERYHVQDDVAARERTSAEGHCVRAMYLLAACVDLAKLAGDKQLLDACYATFDNVINKKMYITGGIGSTRIGEAFTLDYDLPNRTAYSETCAAISLAMVAQRLIHTKVDSRYADIVEKVLYNGMLSGISMDGKAFFYENPLEIDPEFNNPDTSASPQNKRKFSITERVEVFGCSCCPPNLVRFISSVGDLVYTYDEDVLYVHQYMNSDAASGDITITQRTQYPLQGQISISCSAGGRKLALRIPSWCREFSIDRQYVMKDGYAIVDGEGEINLSFDMTPTIVRANRRVHAAAGKVAIMRGPVVYCMEGIDNGRDIRSIRLDTQSPITIMEDKEFILPSLGAKGIQYPETDSLYYTEDISPSEIDMRLIPYYAFANRGTTEMCVWILEK